MFIVGRTKHDIAPSYHYQRQDAYDYAQVKANQVGKIIRVYETISSTGKHKLQRAFRPMKISRNPGQSKGWIKASAVRIVKDSRGKPVAVQIRTGKVGNPSIRQTKKYLKKSSAPFMAEQFSQPLRKKYNTKAAKKRRREY
jgi:hypothetical protein